MSLQAHSRSLLACLVAMAGVAAQAQGLPVPPLAPDEHVISTTTGCAVVGVWSEAHQRRNGIRLASVKANLQEIEFDRSCPAGELITGHPGQVSSLGGRRLPPTGLWYLHGRRFGIVEPTAAYPSLFVEWERRSATLPLAVDTAEDFDRTLRRREFFSVIFNDDGDTTEVFASFRADPLQRNAGAPKLALNVRHNDRVVSPVCGTPQDPAACFALWQQHAGPVLAKARALLDEARPLIQARREAVTAHLRAQGRQP